MSDPLVSVIVPSYNQGRFIRETLDSILAQDYRPLEVVVVDGASEDGTVDVLRDYDAVPELRWVSEPDEGVVEAVNKGLRMAEGVFAGIQSSDDTYLPGAVGAAVDALVEDPELAFVFGDIVKTDEEGRETSRTELAPFSLEAVLAVRTWIPQPGTFFRLAVARELGGWRPEVEYAADTDLWLRIAVHHPARKLDRLMATRRHHGEQRDHQGDVILSHHARAVRDLIEIHDLPPDLRRAAAAGRLRMKNRYGPPVSHLAAVGRYWRIQMLDPAGFRDADLGSLVPGWYPLRKLAASLLS